MPGYFDGTTCILSRAIVWAGYFVGAIIVEGYFVVGYFDGVPLPIQETFQWFMYVFELTFGDVPSDVMAVARIRHTDSKLKG